MKRFLCILTTVIFLIMGCTETQTVQVVEPAIKNYIDTQTGISFSYPEEWGEVNQELLSYTATKITDLSTEKTIPGWEMPNISPQEEATGEEAFMEKILTNEETLDKNTFSNDFFTFDVQREIIRLANGKAAYITTHFATREGTTVERMLRFYKNDIQVVITLKLPIVKTGNSVTEWFENLKKDCLKPEVLAEIDLFKTMTDTIMLS